MVPAPFLPPNTVPAETGVTDFNLAGEGRWGITKLGDSGS